MIQPTFRPVVFGYETFATRPNPPAIFLERNIGSSDAGEAASNGSIIVDPVIERGKPASIQPIASAPLAVQGGTSVEKVTVMRETSPFPTHATSVTL
ncbi:MAG: hypothetical protein CBCREVIR_1609 [Candidatus Burkholderia crenata]|nr:MAG: hypothetical protein CBCREVIR_1609 [Candidatus Burkholderia crenata]